MAQWAELPFFYIETSMNQEDRPVHLTAGLLPALGFEFGRKRQQVPPICSPASGSSKKSAPPKPTQSFGVWA